MLALGLSLCDTSYTLLCVFRPSTCPLPQVQKASATKPETIILPAGHPVPTSLSSCHPARCLSSQPHDTLCQDEAAAAAYLQAIRKVRSDIEEDWRRLHEAAPGVMLSLFRDLVAGISANVQDSEPVAGQQQSSASVLQSFQAGVASDGFYHAHLCHMRNAAVNIKSCIMRRPALY